MARLSGQVPGAAVRGHGRQLRLPGRAAAGRRRAGHLEPVLRGVQDGRGRGPGTALGHRSDPQLRGPQPQPGGRHQRDGNQYAIPLLYGLGHPSSTGPTCTRPRRCPTPSSSTRTWRARSPGRTRRNGSWWRQAAREQRGQPAGSRPTRSWTGWSSSSRPRSRWCPPPSTATWPATRPIWPPATSWRPTWRAPTQWIELTKQGVDIAFVTPDEGFIGFSCGYFLMAGDRPVLPRPRMGERGGERRSCSDHLEQVQLRQLQPEGHGRRQPALLVDVFGLGNANALDGVTLLDSMADIDKLNDAWVEVKASAGV